MVGLPEVSVGVIPGGGGTQLLTRRVGWSRAADLVFTARRLTAAEALAHGCVDRVVPAGQAREAAIEIATAIAANSPVGLRQAKRAMRLGLDVDLATGLAVEDSAWRATAFSPDRAEGVRAFAERRAPQWPVGRGDATGGFCSRHKLDDCLRPTMTPMTRVLLAEDDASIAEPLARALRREGYEVDVRADGPSALAGARDGRRPGGARPRPARAWTGSTCAARSARPAATCRCWCSPRAPTRSTPSSAWTPAPTTT